MTLKCVRIACVCSVTEDLTDIIPATSAWTAGGQFPFVQLTNSKNLNL